MILVAVSCLFVSFSYAKDVERLSDEQLDSIVESRPYEYNSDIISTQTIFPGSNAIQYKVHCANIGWQGWKNIGEIAGTIGESRRMEAIQMITNGVDIGIRYQPHVRDIGWMGWFFNGEVAGTIGQERQMEAIKIMLTNNPDDYSVYYKVHMAKIGWGPWQKDGEVAGSTGQGRQIEAIQILLIEL